MGRCAAFACHADSSKDKRSFFKFPREPKRRKLWVDKVNRGGSATKKFVPSRRYVLCMEHFEDSQFVIAPLFAQQIGFQHDFHLRLKSDAVPTIFEKTGKMQKKERKSAVAISKKKMLNALRSSVREMAKEFKKNLPQVKIEIDVDTSDPFITAALSSPTSTQVTEENDKDIGHPPMTITSVSSSEATASLKTMKTEPSDSDIQIGQYGSCPMDWFSNLTSKDDILDTQTFLQTNNESIVTHTQSSATPFGEAFETQYLPNQTVKLRKVLKPVKKIRTTPVCKCTCNCGRGRNSIQAYRRPPVSSRSKPTQLPKDQSIPVAQNLNPEVRSFSTQTEAPPECYSEQTQTPYNLVKRRSVYIQFPPILKKQSKREQKACVSESGCQTEQRC